MHELPVTESILEIALRHANQVQAKKITDLHLVMGQLSSLVDDSIQFYWEIIAKDTIAEGAKLHFKRIPLEMKCNDCDYRYHPSEIDFICPNCTSYKVSIIAGKEFYMDSIEIE